MPFVQHAAEEVLTPQSFNAAEMQVAPSSCAGTSIPQFMSTSCRFKSAAALNGPQGALQIAFPHI